MLPTRPLREYGLLRQSFPSGSASQPIALRNVGTLIESIEHSCNTTPGISAAQESTSARTSSGGCDSRGERPGPPEDTDADLASGEIE